MREGPILFSSPMVRAILEGRKTQTRRVWKKQPYISRTSPPNFSDTKVGDLFISRDPFPTGGPVGLVIEECESLGIYHGMGAQQFIEKHGPKAYGIPGDRLWVRETFCEPINHGDLRNNQLRAKVRGIEYAADMGIERFPVGENFKPQLRDFHWRPSIFMPRWASRITLKITDVRVQRVQEISHNDALAEGVDYDVSKSDGAPVPRFHALWDTINAKRGYSWASNPWVWAITFKRI